MTRWTAHRAIQIGALAVQFFGLAMFLTLAVRVLAFPYPLHLGEGPILDQVARLAAGEPLYRTSVATPPYIITNYPPVFMLAQWPFFELFGPALWYGRAISQLSALAAGLCVALTVHRLGGERGPSLLAGLAAVTAPAIAYWSQLNRIDALALALSWAGIATVIRGRPGPRALVAGAALLTASIYTRQTFLLAGPAAVAAWLVASRRWRDAAMMVGLVALSSAAIFFVLNWWTGGGFLFNTVTGNSHQLDFRRLEGSFIALGFMAPALVVSGAAAMLFVRGPSAWFARAYLVAAAVAALSVAKPGSAVNYWFELLAGCAAGLGLVLSRVSRAPGPVQVALLALLSANTLLGLRDFRYGDELYERMERRDGNARLLALVRDAGPPALVDDASALVPLAGQRLYIESLLMKYLQAAGHWSSQPLVDDIRRRRFPLILLTDTLADDGWVIEERWSPEVVDAIRAHYQRTERVPVSDVLVTSVYRPK